MIIFTCNADFVENLAVFLETVASEFRHFREGQWQGIFLGKFPTENARIADFPNCEPVNQIFVSKLNPNGTEVPVELFP